MELIAKEDIRLKSIVNVNLIHPRLVLKLVNMLMFHQEMRMLFNMLLLQLVQLVFPLMQVIHRFNSIEAEVCDIHTLYLF